jgi:hypothetical protein
MEILSQTTKLLNKLESLQETNAISHNYTNATANRDLTLDHTPIFATLST